jgi:hypothetical protein
MLSRYHLRWLLLALTLLFATPALAAESIKNFVHTITVNADGSLDVREEITVNSEGQTINHGIERDFPVRFTDYSGQRRTTSFELASVERDGQDEPYELIPIDNGVRVRIGSGDVTLKPGLHKYVLTYTSANQVHSEAGRDILYWNVTGNGWELPIEKASAVVSYPRALKPEELKLESHSGMLGSAVTSNSKVTHREGQSYFETTKMLPTGWGLTIVAILPKDVLSLPAVAAESVQPGMNGVGPLGSGASGAGGAPSGQLPMGQGFMGIPTIVWVIIIVLVVFSLMGRQRGGGCSGCGCIPIPMPFGCMPGMGGCGPGGFGGMGGGGGGYYGGGGGGSGGGGFGGGRSSGGGSFGGGSSGGGGGGGGGRGW